jgi:DNA-binding transcriptional ArsR family regulator
MPLEASEVFKVLGVGTRLRILELLKTSGPMGVNSLAENLGISAAAVSQHLRVLKHAGLVTPERKGYWIPYSLDEEALENCRCLVNEVCSCGCHGPAEQKQQELAGLSLADLRTYEKELQMELERVQGKIAQLSPDEE